MKASLAEASQALKKAVQDCHSLVSAFNFDSEQQCSVPDTEVLQEAFNSCTQLENISVELKRKLAGVSTVGSLSPKVTNTVQENPEGFESKDARKRTLSRANDDSTSLPAAKSRKLVESATASPDKASPTLEDLKCYNQMLLELLARHGVKKEYVPKIDEQLASEPREGEVVCVGQKFPKKKPDFRELLRGSVSSPLRSTPEIVHVDVDSASSGEDSESVSSSETISFPQNTSPTMT